MPVDIVEYSTNAYEDIMNSLLSWIQQNTGYGTPTQMFQTYQRGVVMWEKLGQVVNGNPLVRQPALFLYDGVGFGGGVTKYQQRYRATPVVRVIQRTIVIYAKLPGPAGLPGGMQQGAFIPTGSVGQYTGGGSLLHPLISAVELAMETSDDPSQGTLTLGGLVSHCWLEGDGILVSPDIDDNGQGMATLPVSIQVPLGVQV